MPSNYDYFVPREQTAFDVGVKKALNGEQLTSDEDFDTLAQNLSPEQIKALFEKAGRSDQEKEDQQRAREDADAFIKLHPEIRDTTQNAYQLRAHCMSAFNTPYPTVEMLEAANQSLRANNLLSLNEVELAKQANARATSRAKTIREEAFNEDDAYGLDLEEVRRRANAVLRRR